MSTTPRPTMSRVVWMVPDIGMALPDAPVPVPAPATTNVSVVVWVAPEAVRALTTIVWGPGSSGVVGVNTQLPLASVVTVTVCVVSE